MFQRNKRNSSSDVIARSQISVVSQTTADDQSIGSQSLNRYHSHRRAFGGRAVAPSTVEEREAGADSPTFAESSQIGKEIPQGHVENILRFYGGDDVSSASLDLYRDVLKVSPDASDREIRIAYFRRGREILGDNSGKADQASGAVVEKNANKLDETTKDHFQAVSMAFEILSKPSWKETYLQQGLKRRSSSAIGTDVDSKVPAMNSQTTMPVEGSSQADPLSPHPLTLEAAFSKASNSNIGKQKGKPTKPRIGVAQRRRHQRQMLQKLTPKVPPIVRATTPSAMPPVLRKSSFSGKGQNGSTSLRSTRSNTQRSTSSVRWKDHVEELVFANHPNEHAYDDSDDSDYESNEEDEILELAEIRERERIRENTRQNTFAGSGGKQANLYSNNRQSGNALDANSSDGSVGSSRSQRRKKNKPRIVIDSAELESHLQLIDDEAEKHFVKDFWDNFEESMDGILSLVDSIGGGGDTAKKTPRKKSSTGNSYLLSKQKSSSRKNRDAADAPIKRSLSHDAVASPKNKVVVDCNSEEFMKRSSSFPSQRSSPSTLDAISPSPQPFSIDRSDSSIPRVVSPDQKGSSLAKASPDTRASSPFETSAGSWPFPSSKSPESKTMQENNQPKPKLSPIRVVVTPPMLVTSSSKSKSKTSSNKKGVTLPSTDQDTTMSLASTIFSNSPSQQQLFRPISPTGSEASAVVESDILPASSASSLKKKGGQKSAAVLVDESDQFDMQSRLSGMESVDLAELENPFRTKAPSPHSSPARSASVSKPKSSKKPVVSSHREEKGDRFKVSMTSKVRGSPAEKEVSSYSGSSKFDQSVEDVFAGVEEDTPLERYDMPGGDNLKMEDISIKGSPSHMSDLSESVCSARKENEVRDQEVKNEVPAAKPSVEKPATNSAPLNIDTGSVLSASTKKSLAERSQASSACSSYASSTARDDNCTEIKGLEGLEDAGFFEYFMAYVSAVMTECANVGATSVGEDYHQDFLSLFSNDACVHHTTEVREQPTSVRRPSVASTKSTASS